MKGISILGSTGSIGTQTLEVVRREKDKFKVVSLSAGENYILMEKQAREFMPESVCMSSEESARELKVRLADTDIKVFGGEDAAIIAATAPSSETVVASIVGIAGLKPVLSAILEKKDIALANKETLVAAGEIVMKTAMENKVNILPVDSEHCAIFQCLMGHKEIERIILTASGGPFFKKTKEELSDVKVEDALCHPTWKMGAKITIDSATLANKGLEVIEASHLFGVSVDDISVAVHPQSIVHSMVEFTDGAILAQMGTTDMKNPIGFALNWPERSKALHERLDLFSIPSLEFEKPDIKTFKSLALAYEAGRKGGTLPSVFNGANEEAVGLFLKGKCRFLDIANVTKEAMENHKLKLSPTLSDIFEADKEAREFVRRYKWA